MNQLKCLIHWVGLQLSLSIMLTSTTTATHCDSWWIVCTQIFHESVRLLSEAPVSSGFLQQVELARRPGRIGGQAFSLQREFPEHAEGLQPWYEAGSEVMASSVCGQETSGLSRLNARFHALSRFMRRIFTMFGKTSSVLFSFRGWVCRKIFYNDQYVVLVSILTT